jgi:hypothetical protein
MRIAIMLGKFLSSKPVIAKEKLLMSCWLILRKYLTFLEEEGAENIPEFVAVKRSNVKNRSF